MTRAAKYTEEQAHGWVQSYMAGQSLQQIAIAVGVPKESIYWWLEKLKVPRRRVGRPEVPKPRDHRTNNLKKYGITPAQYDAMLDAQDGVCAICGRPPKGGRTSSASLHVDHDHKTGIVRGLLCNACNLGVGKFMDSPALLRIAAVYLEKPHGRP